MLIDEKVCDMLYVGSNLTSACDKLVKVSLDYIYRSIRQPKPEMETRISQLRIVRDLDVKRYTAMKRMLPYIVCGCFSPPFRKTDNFSFIEYFFVDIDHLVQKGLQIEKVRKELQNDSRVVMCFLSPGEDGLKVLFRLSERCYDHGVYSLFYKQFVKIFAEQYHLEQVVDCVTSDVCRACFLSMDVNAYYNPNPETIDIRGYVDLSDPLVMFEKKKAFEKETKERIAPLSSTLSVDSITTDDLQKIREILKLKTRSVPKKDVYVPQALEDVIADLKIYIEKTGLEVTEILGISYGKKIRMRLGLKQAEVNVFFGKKGFSVVKTPRSGTSQELNDVAAEVISVFFSLL